MCFIPIPFLAPVVIIMYVITFCISNIKYMRDFTMAVYQSDNKQIQISKRKYENSNDKVTDVKEQVDAKLEEDWQKAANMDKTIERVYEDIFQNAFKSMALFNSTAMNKATNFGK